jgi:hypothetical protein
MHPYRPLFEIAEPDRPRRPRELTVAYGALIAVSAIQLVSGAQLLLGALAFTGGAAGLVSNWRSSWKTPSSSC